MTNNLILVGGAVVFKDSRGKRTFLVTKNGSEDKWEIPKVTIRKGESSVRAVLRMIGEMAGMNARVLEEAGRATGVISLNGRAVSQKFYYYLMLLKSGGTDPIGFADYKWLECSKAVKIVDLKREKDMFKQAVKILKEWGKRSRKKK